MDGKERHQTLNMTPDQVFDAIRDGDTDEVSNWFKAHPELVSLKNPAANPESSRWDEISPIHAAAKFGRLELVRILVELGAEVYSNPWSTYPAVIVAAWANQTHVVEYFLQEIPEKADGTNGLGVAANLAGRQGWTDIVRKHIEIDPLTPHQRGWIGDTPMHWPAHNGFPEIVKMLLNAGGDPNAHVLNWIGGTPLHWASERNADIIRMLVAAGARVNEQVYRHDSSLLGATPLIWCAKQPDDCAECASALLELGADPTITDAEGKRAIDYAGERTRQVLLAT